MSAADYIPERGDIIGFDHSPSVGSEMLGYHYALVITSRRFSEATGFAIVIPATSKFHPTIKHVGEKLMMPMPRLPQLPKEKGWLYPHQVKSVDYKERRVKLVVAAKDIPDLDFVIEAMDRVRALIDPDSPV